MGIPSRYSPRRVAFWCMVFLAGWMTLIAGVLILRWTSMTEADQALSIITPDQIMLNVFASVLFWGLVAVTRQNTTVAGIVGMVFYVLFALGTVWAVGNKAHEINVAQNLSPGDKDWQAPIDMLTDPVAAMIHMLRLGILVLVVRVKWKRDEHCEVVDEAQQVRQEQRDENLTALDSASALTSNVALAAAVTRERQGGVTREVFHLDKWSPPGVEVQRPDQWEVLEEPGPISTPVSAAVLDAGPAAQ